MYHYIRSKRRGGGVRLCITKHLQYKQCIDLANNDNIFESISIEIDEKEFDTNKDIIIGCIYKLTNTLLKQFCETL